jgi:hypothetical protein
MPDEGILSKATEAVKSAGRKIQEKVDSWVGPAKKTAAPARTAADTIREKGVSAVVDLAKRRAGGQADPEQLKKLPKYRKGGRVKNTGLAVLHKGEMVVRKGNRKRSRGRGR